VIEQFGVPQDIYDWPATKFVAKFIGSPSMNFLEFEGGIAVGGTEVVLSGTSIGVPEARESRSGRLTLGVRPEHIRFSDASAYRATIVATEYLGTTQIVTLATPNGEVKARISSAEMVRPGETVGLDARTVTIFEATEGRALLSRGNWGVLADG
jgi:multiple sugar transport system ATP-binding protein